MKERDYDVIVYGAGPEGIAVALAATERSARVLLVDECPDVGGSAVCGLLNSWRGEAVAALMETVKPLTKRAWGKLIFEPEELSQAFRKLLKASGIDLMLGAGVVKVKAKNSRVKSVSFAGSDGRVKLSAWCYVDASQDFALARLAGCPADEDEAEPSVALLARVGGIDTRVPGVFDADVMKQFKGEFIAEQAVDDIPATLDYPALIPCLRGGTAILSAAGSGVRLGDGPLGRSAAIGICREGVLASIGFLQRNVPGYENCYLIHFASQLLSIASHQPQRRRAESETTEDGNSAIEDVIILTYRDPDRPDATVAVPLGNLLCPKYDNLLLARSGGMASDQIPLLAACGEAAGHVAAEALLYDGYIGKLDPERLRKAFGSSVN